MNTPISTSLSAVCTIDQVLPGTGVCAWVNGHHIAIFRVTSEQWFAIDNVDPRTGRSVLARGLVGNLGEQIVVASPLYKNHIDLRTGQGVEDPSEQVAVYPVHTKDGQVWVAVPS